MSVAKELHLLGVSFRTAPAAVREALSLAESELSSLLQAARHRMPSREIVVISTCNRTEFYLAAPPYGKAAEDWLAHLRQLRPAAPILRNECQLYRTQGIAVANHLFRVACGLDSAILGDAQILGQVRESLGIASRCNSLGGYLQQLFNQALDAGKQARRDTAISSGAAGIGSALAGLVTSRLAHGYDSLPTILMIGAGETAQSIARHIAKRGRWRFLFVNRTEAKARELAGRFGGVSWPWSTWPAAAAEADIVISATSAPQPLLTRSVLESLLRTRSQRPLLVVDAGLPRNVEPGAPVELIDIDAIRELQERTLELRQAAVPQVERMIEVKLQAWETWIASRPLEHAIKQLFLDADRQRYEMARELASSQTVPGDLAERIVWKSLRNILHLHARRLRDLGKQPAVSLVAGA